MPAPSIATVRRKKRPRTTTALQQSSWCRYCLPSVPTLAKASVAIILIYFCGSGYYFLAVLSRRNDDTATSGAEEAANNFIRATRAKTTTTAAAARPLLTQEIDANVPPVEPEAVHVPETGQVPQENNEGEEEAAADLDGSSSSSGKDDDDNKNKKQRQEQADNTKHGGGRIKSDFVVQVPSSSSSLASSFDPAVAKRALKEYGAMAVRGKPITAYVENPSLNEFIVKYGDRGDMNNPKDPGTPHQVRTPQPLRTHAPQDLIQYQYPRVETCHDMPGKFPVDRGLQLDPTTGQPVVWNVGTKPTVYPEFADQEAPHCPVEADPYLPWIHDVFPNTDGTLIHFVAQNKRKCRTGTDYTDNVHRLLPQISLMQSVSVEVIDESIARKIAPELWHPSGGDGDRNFPRYRLAPYDEATKPQGMFTRFICRFHGTEITKESEHDGPPKKRTVYLGETLSVYPYNYDLVAFRKGHNRLHSTKGKDTIYFWTSNIRFDCPVPEELQSTIRSGSSVLSDGTPTLFVNVIPIRTSPRYQELHFTEDMIGPVDQWYTPRFDATKHWGPKNVVPRVEASGRWENIPICQPPKATTTTTTTEEEDTTAEADITTDSQVGRPTDPDKNNNKKKKQHTIAVCLWASAEFLTRGQSKHGLKDTHERLREWLEFHILVGVDHFYVYDNSGAHTNRTSLLPVLEQYGSNLITRIEWPAIVCNNNIPAHDNCGERSSQYAAENSCRTRFGPFAEWIAVIDTDEYLVPMGNYTSLKDVVRDAGNGGTKVLSFRSSRGRLRRDASADVGRSLSARAKLPNTTYLEAYNCDSVSSYPKPSWAERARKQLYKPDYVLYHFVHYSTVTTHHLETYAGTRAVGKEWKSRFHENPVEQRNTNELREAVMVHTKTLSADKTDRYKDRCRVDFAKKWQGCWVAYPWPNGKYDKRRNHDDNGMEYNCIINDRVDQYWLPKLRDAMKKRQREMIEAAA